ncbi:MAG: hypothetical protein DK306_000299 [Chloroflexi bacterium]|nr:MAG: hypothetical protein DK306_000299 [Chloroflexota bacterium]
MKKMLRIGVLLAAVAGFGKMIMGRKNRDEEEA